MTEAAAADPIKDPVNADPANPPAAAPAANPDPVNPAAADPKADPKAADPVVNADPAKADPVVKPDWPDDWREKMAGGDAKELERLKRFASPAAVYTSNRELEKKLSSTPLKKVLPENPTAEDLAAYRKDNGVPEKPEDYDTKLADGLVIGEDDKPIVDNYLKIAHENHMKPEQVKSVLEWYYKDMQAQQEARQALDMQQASETKAILQAEWGADFKRNSNLIEGYFGEEQWNRITSSRLPDGRPIVADPDILRLFADRARDYNPVATNVGGGGDARVSIEARIEEIKGMMADRNSAYHQGPKSATIQAEYRDLITAKQKYNKK